MADLLNVAEIIKKPSGLVFFYDTEGRLLETPRAVKEIRRLYNPGFAWSLQFTFEDNGVTNVNFSINRITLIQYAAGKFQTFTDLGATFVQADYEIKFEAVYDYLANYVFIGCCDDDPDNPSPFPYPSATWAEWLATLQALGGIGLLPKGLWIEVTLIPSQPGAIFSLFCTETNEIALGGFGQFLNADWQNVGDYSGVLALTSVAFTNNVGQWYSGLEYITIDYSALAGGTFAPSDTITDTTTGATGTVISDDGVSQMVVQPTGSGFAFTATNTIDNGTGVTATIDTITPLVVTGDVVIYNCLHYQLIDETLIDGTDPVTNTAAYTLLPITTADMGYINEVDEIEFDFVPDWLQYRKDKRGKEYAYSQATDSIFSLGFTAINLIQWGRDSVYDHFINESRVNFLNAVFSCFAFNIVNISSFDQNEINSDVSFITLNQAEFELNQVNFPLDTFELIDGAVANKIFDATCRRWFIRGTLTFTETISSSINEISVYSGYSNYPQTIDITGLTTLDLSTVEFAGIYNITGGASETINLISNYPTLFPFTLKPEAGLVLTVTFTPFASLSANDEIVGGSASVVLDGDKGESLTLEAATISTFAVTKQIEICQIA